MSLISTSAGPVVSRSPRWERAYATRLLITDTAVVVLSVLLAQYLRFGHAAVSDVEASKQLTGFSAAFVVVWLSALSIFRTRSLRVIGTGIDEYRRVLSASFWTFGVIAIVTLLLRLEVARGYLAVALPVGAVGLVVSRHLWRGVLARGRARGDIQTTVVAIGDRAEVSILASELTRNPVHGYRIVGIGIPGYGDPCGETVAINGRQVPIIGNEHAAVATVARGGVDTLAITGTEHFGVQGIRDLTWTLDELDVDLVVSPGVMDVTEARLVMRPVANFPLIHVEKPQYHGAARFAKRAFDFTFALIALIAAAPVMLVAAAAIKFTSRGPVFYCAERIGKDGQPFTMLKFRTMVDGADRQVVDLLARNEFDGGVLFKMRDDPRVTPVGRLLRRLSIDELPQFVNVLKQDMSVVGPRPPLRREVESYDGKVSRRLLVKPGITGLWQVNGRSDLSWDESVRLDLSYIENWSMAGDLVIIGKTLRAVLRHEGAY
ncbi:sugar transferase [Mycobacterium sp. pV006]|uniref:sugar transferase n=1 Tax=Mycobacterium sp. pV006 TaxID=3238983 RepID=UPI00351B36AF